MLVAPFWLAYILAAFLTLVSASPSPFNHHRAVKPAVSVNNAQNAPAPTLKTSFLDAHNAVRAEAGAKPLTWSTNLAAKAQEWADKCDFSHTEGSLMDTPYGENIAAATHGFTPEGAVNTFVADKAKYNPAKPSYTHWTQVVWKSTTQLGCASAQCQGIFDPSLGMATLYVCLYDPAGNVIGQAPQNVEV